MGSGDETSQSGPEWAKPTQFVSRPTQSQVNCALVLCTLALHFSNTMKGVMQQSLFSASGNLKSGVTTERFVVLLLIVANL